MKKIEEFIDKDLNYYSNFGDSEVEMYDANEIDSDIVNYLKEHYRFDYKDICVYYVGADEGMCEFESDAGEIWVENMAA